MSEKIDFRATSHVGASSYGTGNFGDGADLLSEVMMTVFNRRNPNERYSAMNDLGQETIERTSSGGGRWMWVWPVIVALVFWWAGWGWGGSGGWWWGHNHSQNAQIMAHPGSPTTETGNNAGVQPSGGAQILASNDKAEYIGLHFNCSHIPVQKRVNSKVMWIGEDKPMLAVVNGSADGQPNTVSQGTSVNADGLVEQAPPAREAKEAWALSDQDASQLEKQGAFIEISQLTVSQNGEGR